MKRSSLPGAWRVACGAGVVALMSLAGTSHAQYSTPKKTVSAPEAPATEATAKAAEKILIDLGERGDIGQARRESDALLKKVATENGTAGDLVVAARVRRIVNLLEAGMKGGSSSNAKPGAGAGASSEIKGRTAYLIASPKFADSLAWSFDAKRDSGSGVFKVVGDFVTAKVAVESYADLAAAVAVVHDQPNPRKQEWSLDHLAMMAYFSRGGFKPFSTTKMPVCLLVHVVDMVIGGGETDWVKRQLGPQNLVGKRYFDVRYDNMFFKHGQKKQIEGHPYTLENIRKHGGVCVEQAYYAEQVGKSCGIPSVTVTAKGDDVGHAWVGYLKTTGKGFAWDMTEGRYKEYKGEAASVREPQTGESISDGELSMVAERAMWNQDAVRLCLALSDAAMLADEPAAAMDLCERAVNACPFVPAAWERAAELVKKQGFKQADLEKWGGAIVTMCGTTYPDFAMKILTPLVATIEKPLDRAPAWAWIRARLVDSQRNRTVFRYDLAVKLLMLEADALRDGENLAGAWGMYRASIEKYGKETPAVQEAAIRCERMLTDAGKGPRDVAEFWKWAWGKTDEPDDMSAEFAMGSNWSVFGLRYASALERSGDKNGAEGVRKKILPKRK